MASRWESASSCKFISLGHLYVDTDEGCSRGSEDHKKSTCMDVKMTLRVSMPAIHTHTHTLP